MPPEGSRRRAAALKHMPMSEHLDTIRSLLTVQTFAPPALGSEISSIAHLPPKMIAIEGVGLVIGLAWWQLVEQRRQLIRQSPVGYLLSINKALSARTIVGRRARLLGSGR